MREIKFRAYDKTAKQMYRVDRLGIGKYSHQQYAEGDEQPKTGKNKFYPSQVEIMQCTGIKDKNGVEIYEGDIIKYRHKTFFKRKGERVYDFKNEKCYVVWDEEGASFILNKYFNKVTNKSYIDILVMLGEDTMEVIGNIYEVENEKENNKKSK